MRSQVSNIVDGSVSTTTTGSSLDKQSFKGTHSTSPAALPETQKVCKRIFVDA